METETTDDLIMAGFIGSPIWAVVDHTTSSALHSDAEDDDDDDDDDDHGEALSFCDLAIYADNSNGGSSSSQQYQSNQHSSGGGEPQDHDFEFAPCGSHVRSAEDLFYKGRLLPLLPRRAAEMEHPALDCDLAAFRKSYSCKENRSAAALPAKVRTWRMNSLDSHTSRGFGFSRSSSRASGAASAPTPARTRKPAPKVGAAARAPPKPAKSSSLKWQFFTLGLMKTPPMRLDDIRLRQGRPSNADRSSSSCVSEFSVSGSVLRRTVSCSSQDDVVTPATAPSLAAGKVKSKSVKDNILCPAEPETARTSSSSSSSSSSKAWRMLKPLTALNGCRASSTSVVNCSSSSTARKQAPRSHDGFTNQNNNNNNAKLVSLSRLSEPHQQHRHDRPPLFCKISA